MNNKVMKIVVGQDLTAYAEIDVPAGTDLSDENLAKIANAAVEREMFDADWSSVNALRVVSVHDAEGSILKSDISIEPCNFDGGQVLRSFLKGYTEFGALIHGAAVANLIDPIEEIMYEGKLKHPCGVFAVAFSARKGATQAELDIAFMQGLAQQCTIGYLAVGNKAAPC